MFNLFKKERTYNPDKYKVVQLDDGRYGVSIFQIDEWLTPVVCDNLNDAISAANRWTQEDNEFEQVKALQHKEA